MDMMRKMRLATSTTTMILLLLSLLIMVCNGHQQQNEEEQKDDEDEFVQEEDLVHDYEKSWSWSIFAIFMWLVPQISIIVGDYRESLFNSIIWNKPSISSIIKRSTQEEEEEEVSKKVHYNTKKSVTLAASTEEGDMEETAGHSMEGDDEEEECEEGPIPYYKKGNVVLVDDDDDDDDLETNNSNNHFHDAKRKSNNNNNNNSIINESFRQLSGSLKQSSMSFVRNMSVQATNIVFSQDNNEEDSERRAAYIIMCPKLKQGLKAVRQAALFTIGLWMVLIVIAAIGISLSTDALDERMVLVLEGLSRVFGAAVMSAVSFTIPSWAGLYFTTYADRSRNLGRGSPKELRFNVRWALHRPFCTSFIFMLPFFEGVAPAKIPISIISGIATGFIVDASVYYARRFQSRFRRNLAIGLFAAIWGTGAAVVMAEGAWFIGEVWWEGEGKLIVSFGVVVGWFLLLLVGHMARLFYSRHRREYLTQKLGMDTLNDTSSANPTAAARPRMATSLIMGRVRGGMKSNAQDLEGKHGWDFRRATSSMEDDEKNVSAIQKNEKRQSWGLRQLSSDDFEMHEDGLERNTTSQRQHTTSRELQIDLSNIQEEHDDDDSDVEYDEDYFVNRKVTKFANDLIKNSNKAATSQDKKQWDEDDDEEKDPSYYELFFQTYKCCGCTREEAGRTKSWIENLTSILSWTIWWIGVLGSLFVVAINIGSTYQQEAARAKLPYVSEVLYDNMNEGPVCAFDNRGPDSTIKTFPNQEAAHAEGFLVVHCGACAACSDWHNLRLEYTTRDYLAKESARCARKSLMGGADAVTSCLEKEPVGFQGECAICWTEDILCTKNFCAVIFLQSLLINSVGNFQVGPDTITSASCEEAHCEAGNPGDFVYCSGATRRRMNVTSTIGRPGAQQCGIVDVVWEEVFPE